MKTYQETPYGKVIDPAAPDTVIPKDPSNRHWQRIQEEIAKGEAEIVPQE